MYNNLRGDKSKYWIYFILVIYCSFAIFVMFWIFMTSVKDNKEFYANIWSLPKSLHFENYIKAWDILNLKQCFLNSVIVSLGATLALNFIGAATSYVLIRSKLKIIKWLNVLFAIGISVPLAMIALPIFVYFSKIGLGDSLIGLIIVYITIHLSFTIFLLVGFMRSIPLEIEESAIIDGCSYLGAFWKIVFPLSMPGIITASIFNFIFFWNEYFLALIFITGESRRTISLGVYSLTTAMLYTSDWTGMFAGVVILVIPTVIIFILLSEKIIAGMTRGAIKG